MSFRHAQPQAWALHRAGAAVPSAERPPTILPPPTGGLHGAAAAEKRHPGAERIELPAGTRPSISLAEALDRRLSCRRFSGAALDLPRLAGLLDGAYGHRGWTTVDRMHMPLRPLPSGGGAFPLELYLVVRRIDGLEPGVWHWVGAERSLERLRGSVPWRAVVPLFFGQPWLLEADAIAVVTAVVGRTLDRYGERGMRYVYFESGHLMQNLALVAAGLDVGALPLGGFYDDQVAGLLGVDAGREPPLYAAALGRPATKDPAAVREVAGDSGSDG